MCSPVLLHGYGEHLRIHAYMHTYTQFTKYLQPVSFVNCLSLGVAEIVTNAHKVHHLVIFSHKCLYVSFCVLCVVVMVEEYICTYAQEYALYVLSHVYTKHSVYSITSRPSSPVQFSKLIILGRHTSTYREGLGGQITQKCKPTYRCLLYYAPPPPIAFHPRLSGPHLSGSLIVRILKLSVFSSPWVFRDPQVECVWFHMGV